MSAPQLHLYEQLTWEQGEIRRWSRSACSTASSQPFFIFVTFPFLTAEITARHLRDLIHTDSTFPHRTAAQFDVLITPKPAHGRHSEGTAHPKSSKAEMRAVLTLARHRGSHFGEPFSPGSSGLF